MAAAPLLLAPQDAPSPPIEAPRRTLEALCRGLPSDAMADADGVLRVPLDRASTTLLTDFCQRYCNVNGREASVELAWRKAVRPQLTGTGSMCRLYEAARHMGCAPLEHLCCDALSIEHLHGRDAHALRTGGLARWLSKESMRALLEAWVVAAERTGHGDAVINVVHALGAPAPLEGDGTEQDGRALVPEPPQTTQAHSCESDAWRSAACDLLERRHDTEALGLGTNLETPITASMEQRGVLRRVSDRGRGSTGAQAHVQHRYR